MSDLIQALQIFAKYNNSFSPTLCDHDEFRVNVSPSVVSDKDIELLEELSFHTDDELDNFYSYRFGSC